MKISVVIHILVYGAHQASVISFINQIYFSSKKNTPGQLLTLFIRGVYIYLQSWMENIQTTTFVPFHLSSFKKRMILDLLVGSEKYVFSFGFYRNLSNRETTKVASFISLLEEYSFGRGGGMFVFGAQIQVTVSCANPCSVCCWIYPLLGNLFSMWSGGVRFLRKLSFLFDKSCLVG